MHHFPMRTLGRLALLGPLLLGACDSAEERAEGHHLRAAALLAEGDADLAVLEFRNALQAMPEHIPSLRDYAALLRDRGDVAGATREYMRLAALRPEDAGVQLALASLALRSQDFAAVEAHVARAYALAPDDLNARAMRATVAFREGETEEARALAEGVLAEAPGNVPAHLVLIAGNVGASDFEQALVRADAALEQAPADLDLHLARLGALEQLGDADGVRAQLEAMNGLFPENGVIAQALLRWYLENGRSDEAIALMRAVAGRLPDDPGARLGLVDTIFRARGAQAARAELVALIGSAADPSPYQLALGRLDYAEGRRDEAIAALRALAQGGEGSPAVRDVQIALARMLEGVGRKLEARPLAEAVLADDPRHVDALKMRARWLIEEDRTEDAHADLKAAGLQAPRDPEVMTLAAAAHEREGAAELVGERLARAVEASGFRAAESLRYAFFLLEERRFPQAEGVVLDSLRRHPENRDLLVALGRVHLGRDDLARARDAAGRLRELGDPAALEAATALEAAALRAEGRTEDTLALLEDAARRDDASMRARGSLVEARLAAGDVEGARAEIDAILADDAASVPGRMLLAGLQLFENRPAEAERIYRAVIEEAPRHVEPYRVLAGLLNGLGRANEASALLESGLAATGRASALLELRAGQHYRQGEHEAAIAVYEELYASDTGNVLVANNLASLLAAHRDDPESHDRAFAVARRLRGTEIPHFQDTYGWLMVLRGDPEQALSYLEPAAEAIPGDPVVHYHLGMAYDALGRWDDARAALTRAVDVAGPGSDLPQVAAARRNLKEIGSRRTEG